jgi:hypothetical protein
MADTQDTFNLPVAESFYVQLEGLGNIIITNLLTQLAYREMVATILAPVALTIIDDSTFCDLLRLASGAMGKLLHS